jgi:hypothetical protein
MMTRHQVAALAAIVLMALGCPRLAQAEPDAAATPLFGAVSGQTLFAALAGPEDQTQSPWGSRMGRTEPARTLLWLCQTPVSRPAVSRAIRLGFPDDVLHWQIAYSRCWIARGGSDGISLYNRVDYLNCYQLQAARQGKMLEGPDDSPFDGHGLGHFISESGSPLSALCKMSSFADFKVQLHYAYLPLSQDSVRLFLLSNLSSAKVERRDGGIRFSSGDAAFKKPRWQMVVHHCQEKCERESRLRFSLKWTAEEMLTPAFQEPFQAFAVGQTYLFVTQSGKVYAAPKAEKGERQMKAVWDDPERPVVGLLSDADNDRLFLFCKPSRGPDKGVYFELSAKPDPLPYDLAGFPPSKADEPLRTLLRYAQFLAAERKIKAN